MIAIKVDHGKDAAVGQLLKYMGWIHKHLADGNQLKGVIDAAEIPEKLRCNVTQVPNVNLIEYLLEFMTIIFTCK